MKNLPPLVPDPVIEFYKAKIDRAALRENMKLTFEQRWERIIEAERLRDGNLVYDGSHI